MRLKSTEPCLSEMTMDPSVPVPGADGLFLSEKKNEHNILRWKEESGTRYQWDWTGWKLL